MVDMVVVVAAAGRPAHPLSSVARVDVLAGATRFDGSYYIY